MDTEALHELQLINQRLDKLLEVFAYWEEHGVPTVMTTGFAVRARRKDKRVRSSA